MIGTTMTTMTANYNRPWVGDQVWIQPKNAKIPFPQRIHGLILEVKPSKRSMLCEFWYKVLVQETVKVLPERCLTKIE